MGFAYQPYDWSSQAFKDTFRLMDRHGDIVMVTFDGYVPWQEALEGKPFHPAFDAELKKLEKGLPRRQKRLLALGVLASNRVELAGYQGASGQPRQGTWKSKSFDDPAVVKAYHRYAVRMIERFRPDYICYGMEVDAGLLKANDPRFRKLKTLLSQTYRKLKKEYPNTPIFLEFMLQNDQEMEKRRSVIKELLPYTDLYAVSTYPFVMTGGDPADIPEDWFSRVRQFAPGKPFAVMETNHLAENFHHPDGIPWPGDSEPVLIPGTPQFQADYLRRIFKEAQALKAEFVIQWTLRDLDQLQARLNKTGGEFDVSKNPFSALATDCGLYDERGKPRPALAVWEQWRRRALK